MKIILVLVSVMAACSLAFAQTPSTHASRAQEIWNAADSRMGEQADIWYDAGDYPRSTHMLKFMSASNPSDYETASNLGWMFENMERWDEALATYVRLRKNNPGSAEAAYPEAFFYFQQRANAKVPRLLESTLSTKP